MAIPKPKVAVVGCGHGELDAIYATVEARCCEKGWTVSDIDFVIVNGDFQAIRNSEDLNCMSVPYRYRELGDFHKYYSGILRAPILTIVIGGNHEASNYFYELYYGGWLAPNIYYLGAAGVIRYGPWRIAGLSGIYRQSDYQKQHHERLPYDRNDIRSIYHVREYDTHKLLQIRNQIHITLSHDWPAWVELFGNFKDLYNQKPHFLESAQKDGLGSKPALAVMNHLRPAYYFSGHMHVRFSATVQYTSDKMEDTLRQLTTVPETWKAKLPVFKPSRGSRKPGWLIQPPQRPVTSGGTTSFLALDKRKAEYSSSWIELMELDMPEPSDASLYSDKGEDGKFSLHYDAEWLAITRASVDSLRIRDPETLTVTPAKSSQASSASIDGHVDWVQKNIVDKGLLRVPDNFCRHAPIYDPNLTNTRATPAEYPNKQTEEFSNLLQIPNRFTLSGSPSPKDTSSEGDWIDMTSPLA